MTQMQLPFFWPDREGLIKLPPPRMARRHMPRRRSFAIWFVERAAGVVGFGLVRDIAFCTWLKRSLELADFQCLTVHEVINGAMADLKLDQDTVIRFLVRHTSAREEFRSDGQIVTMR
jgi:hypothetical protein